MKTSTFLLILLFSFVFKIQTAHSQDKNEKHNFKIVGLTKLTSLTPAGDAKAVEYDTKSPDHLFISFFKNDDAIRTKTQFRFSNRIFELLKASDYVVRNELTLDGTQTNFREDGSVGSELIFKDGLLQQKTGFYLNGKIKSLISGDEKNLNGEYKCWHTNGQISFSGNYKDNLKHGEFQLFDESGKTIKKGIYQEGKLITGEAVVQDIIYNHPEKSAQYSKGDKSFEEYLKLRSAEINGIKDINGEKKVNLNLVIDKGGRLRKIATISTSEPKEIEIIEATFKDLSGFTPATIEDIPVDSEIQVQVLLSKEGMKFCSVPSDKVYVNVDQMPVFPGGDQELRRFLSMNVRYPVDAMQNGKKGKVFVNFVIDEQGKVNNITVLKGVYPSLDAEAMRVVEIMPDWEPGRMEGKPVKVGYTVPITFNMVIMNE